VSVVQESLPEIIEVLYFMYNEVRGSNIECPECLTTHGSRCPITIEEGDYLSNVRIGRSVKE
jgi:hypothetical protein